MVCDSTASEPHVNDGRPPIRALLLRYTRDGAYFARPLLLEGQVVTDDRHGNVLEFVLPDAGRNMTEYSVQIPVGELNKLFGRFAGVLIHDSP